MLRVLFLLGMSSLCRATFWRP